MKSIYVINYRRKLDALCDEVDELSEEYATMEAAVADAKEQFSTWQNHPDFTRSKWEVERVQFDPEFNAADHARGEGVTYETVFETEWTTE